MQHFRLVYVVVLLLTGALCVGVNFPHQLAYFNEFAGGPANGYRHLLHSSLDWGQDLLEVRDLGRSVDGRIYVCACTAIPCCPLNSIPVSVSEVCRLIKETPIDAHKRIDTEKCKDLLILSAVHLMDPALDGERARIISGSKRVGSSLFLVSVCSPEGSDGN